jgi:hypothetical protein
MQQLLRQPLDARIAIELIAGYFAFGFAKTIHQNGTLQH